MKKTFFFPSTLKTWILSNGILNKLFDIKLCHIEVKFFFFLFKLKKKKILKRIPPILHFLAKKNVLETSHIELLWEASIAQGEEGFSVLAEIFQEISQAVDLDVLEFGLEKFENFFLIFKLIIFLKEFNKCQKVP